MLFDVENELSSSQDFTGSATVSTHSYQKQSAEQDISIGRLMALVVVFEATGAGTTHTLKAIQADNTDFSTNKEVLASRDIAAADVEIGKPYALPIPQGSLDRLHVGFEHEASGGTTTATISAWLAPLDEINEYKTFPKVNTVSL